MCPGSLHLTCQPQGCQPHTALPKPHATYVQPVGSWSGTGKGGACCPSRWVQVAHNSGKWRPSALWGAMHDLVSQSAVIPQRVSPWLSLCLAHVRVCSFRESKYRFAWLKTHSHSARLDTCDSHSESPAQPHLVTPASLAPDVFLAMRRSCACVCLSRKPAHLRRMEQQWAILHLTLSSTVKRGWAGGWMDSQHQPA